MTNVSIYDSKSLSVGYTHNTSSYKFAKLFKQINTPYTKTLTYFVKKKNLSKIFKKEKDVVGMQPWIHTRRSKLGNIPS